MSEFCYNESYEFLAQRFYEEHGLMAPGKSVPLEMAYGEEEERMRWKRWDEFMRERNGEAWELWHREYGYLKSPVPERQSNE